MIPATCEIYLEANGRKIATARSCTATLRKGRYEIALTRICATDEAIRDGLNFHGLEDFIIVIYRRDRETIYSGCQWSRIEETGGLGSMAIDRMEMTAKELIEAHTTTKPHIREVL